MPVRNRTTSKLLPLLGFLSVFLASAVAYAGPGYVAVDDSTATAYAMNILILSSASDADDDELTVGSSVTLSDPNAGAAIVFGANATYTPASNYSGTFTFNFTVSDGTVMAKVGLLPPMPPLPAGESNRRVVFRIVKSEN